MKQILLFGAGKSATVLIDYLKKISSQYKWAVTVADSNLQAVQAKVGKHDFVEAVQADITNETERKQLVQNAQVVISMMPPSLHYLIALDCIAFGKHLLTASYVDDKIKQLSNDIKSKGLLFLCEMGLDPGIDHMSAMKLIHQIKHEGGKITSFKSHCGGLIAPESDNNPWHYKISWNPRNIVLAGKAGAVYKENGAIVKKTYEDLFNEARSVQIAGDELYAYYPNRDSLGYIPLYGLEEAETFIRTTLRHPEFMFGWHNIVDLKLTDEEVFYETDGLAFSDFFVKHLTEHKLTDWMDYKVHHKIAHSKIIIQKLKELEAQEKNKREGLPSEETSNETLLVNENGELETFYFDGSDEEAKKQAFLAVREANLTMKQLFFLDLVIGESHINKGLCSAADVLQYTMEQKLALKPTDKDMIVMLHEIEYEKVNGERSMVKSSLVVKGEDSLHTAMAKTVGLPLGIAAKLILENKLNVTGLHIPTIAEVYEPVLKELEQHGVRFEENFT